MTNSLLGRSILSVVIVNWNGRDDLLECLHSVTKSTYPYVRVIVVDNTSTDGSVAAIRTTFPEVVILESGTNIGLTANNLGIKEGLRQGTEYLLLLNNDTYVDPFCFSRLVEAAEANQMVGVLSPRICYYSERDTIWYDGGELQRHRGMWRSRHICFNESSNGIPVSNYQVDFISGCAMFIKRDVVEVIGCIDSRFFAYWEDVDFSLRARRAGFHLLHVPTAVVYHKVSRSFRLESPDWRYYIRRNQYLLSVKEVNPRRRLFLLWQYFRRCFWEYCSLMDQGEQEHALAVAEAWWHCAIGRHGKRSHRLPPWLVALLERRRRAGSTSRSSLSSFQ